MSEENTAATAAKEDKTVSAVYDADANNRFDLTVRHTDGNSYDTAHIYGPLTDERYVKWLNEFHIKGNEDDVSEEAREASVRLWDDTVVSIADGDGQISDAGKFRDLIGSGEKVESLNKFLAVAIGDSDVSKKKTRFSAENAPATEMCVVTEAWSNNEVVEQRHFLTPKTLELQKKYARIQGKRFKQEKIGGLRRKAKIEYVPQDAKIGEIYDEMLISTAGFANDNVPLRFKTFVVHYVFDDTVTEKKPQP